MHPTAVATFVWFDPAYRFSFVDLNFACPHAVTPITPQTNARVIVVFREPVAVKSWHLRRFSGAFYARELPAHVNCHALASFQASPAGAAPTS
jgi:hypothetical protein